MLLSSQENYLPRLEASQNLSKMCSICHANLENTEPWSKDSWTISDLWQALDPKCKTTKLYRKEKENVINTSLRTLGDKSEATQTDVENRDT